MEYGLDERYAALLRARSPPPPVSSQHTHVFDDLRVHGEFHFAAFTRRSRPRQAFAARKNARGQLAEIRQSPPPVRIYVRASGQEASLYGRRACTTKRILGGGKPGLGARKFTTTPGHTAARRCPASFFFPP